MEEQFQHWIPSVVLLQPLRRGIREIHFHPTPSTEKGESEGSTYAPTEPNTQQHRAARTRRDTRILKETRQKHCTNFWTEPVGQACASFSRRVKHVKFVQVTTSIEPGSRINRKVDPTSVTFLVRDETKCAESSSMVRTFTPHVLPMTVDMLHGATQPQ